MMMIPDIAHTLQPHRHFLVAFSGGLDSSVLLYRLVLWREQDPTVRLRAIHIHHGLSANADDWVAHCQQMCQQWQVPLLVERVALADEGWELRLMRARRATRHFVRRWRPAKRW